MPLVVGRATRSLLVARERLAWYDATFMLAHVSLWARRRLFPPAAPHAPGAR